MIDFKEITMMVGNLEEEKVLQILNDFIISDSTEEEVQEVINAFQDGMAIVGDHFEKGKYSVRDLVFAGELLLLSINVLKPIIGSLSFNKVGSIVLGTVHGDIHDIGKNLFKWMSEAVGFKVYDIGIDQPAQAFVEKVKEVRPDIVGMSGVLTLALESMKNTVDELKEAGLRDSVKIIIGGNPVTNEACEHIGADAFTTNATEGVKISLGWMN